MDRSPVSLSVDDLCVSQCVWMSDWASGVGCLLRLRGSDDEEVFRGRARSVGYRVAHAARAAGDTHARIWIGSDVSVGAITTKTRGEGRGVLLIKMSASREEMHADIYLHI